MYYLTNRFFPSLPPFPQPLPLMTFFLIPCPWPIDIISCLGPHLIHPFYPHHHLLGPAQSHLLISPLGLRSVYPFLLPTPAPLQAHLPYLLPRPVPSPFLYPRPSSH